jgi:tetratricopeptide (TPR) repeat protein
VTSNAETDVAAALQRANLLNDLGRYDEARTVLRGAVAADPNNARVWCLMAQTCNALRDYDAAMAAANNARRIEPENEWAQRLASVILSNTGWHWEAVEAAAEAVRLAPHIWQTHARLAGAYASGGWGLEAAAAAADQAVALSPHEPEAHMAVASAARLRRDVRGATAAYERVLALDPLHARAHTQLAKIEATTSGSSTPAARAKTLTRFARSVRIDPRASYGREQAEKSIKDLLILCWAFVAIDVFVTAATDVPGISILSRAVMALGIAPAVYFAAFWVRLAPDVKPYVRQFLRARLDWVVALSLSTVALGIGAVAPGKVRLMAGLSVFCLCAFAYIANIVRRERADYRLRKAERYALRRAGRTGRWHWPAQRSR